MKKFLAYLFLLACNAARAQECESIIVFSKTAAVTVTDSSAFGQEAANFCSAYSRGASTSSDKNFGASYKFFSASFGQENASVETIASKVCSATNRSSVSQNAYRQYVDTIAPGAFDAYQACISARDSLQFKVNAASMLPDEFDISAHFKPGVPKATAQLRHSESQGIDCLWSGSEGDGITLTAGESATLHCSRKDRAKPGYVKVFNTVGPETLTIRWKQYDKDGNVVDTMVSLTAELFKLKTTVSALQTSVVANQTQTASHSSSIVELVKGTKLIVQPTNQCPPGWVFVTNLFVGIDPNTAAAVTNAGIAPGGGGHGLAMVGPWPGYHPGLCRRP